VIATLFVDENLPFIWKPYTAVFKCNIVYLTQSALREALILSKVAREACKSSSDNPESESSPTPT
jgi:hypothetical protein